MKISFAFSLAYNVTINAKNFQKSILRWFAKHGRTTLPWQENNNAYAIWVSDIMLQQTQVTTVIPYLKRFMQRFPNVATLAKAPLDDVLHIWTGLGYYRRARLLHQTAQIIHLDYHDHLPDDLEALCDLPGIGRSTAGAILSFAYGQSATILDGNVKRVLSRFACIGEGLSSSQFHKQLWALATQYTPKQHCAQYNQAMMDLGALLCTRSKPKCSDCPLIKHCQAYGQNRIDDFPPKQIKKARPHKKTIFLLMHNAHREILLIQRTPLGVWASLWSLPECNEVEDIETVCEQYYQQQVYKKQLWQTFTHTFSHFHLHARVFLITVTAMSNSLKQDDYICHPAQMAFKKVLPSPIKHVLKLVKPLI